MTPTPNELVVFICPCGVFSRRLTDFGTTTPYTLPRCELADQRDPENSLGYHSPLKFTVPLPERVQTDLKAASS